MRVYHYKIDSEGRLFHEGSEINDDSVLKFFLNKLEKDESGQYKVICQGELNWVEAEDVPYVVQNLEFNESHIELIFAGGYRETLSEQSLEVGKDNVLYCKIRNGYFKARFNRKTYFELSRLFQEDKMGLFSLRYAGKQYPIVKRSDSKI